MNKDEYKDIEWRNLHNYKGDNWRQECTKCKQILTRTPKTEFKESEPFCTATDNSSFKTLIEDKYWRGGMGDMKAHFDIEYFPFHTRQITLDYCLRNVL